MEPSLLHKVVAFAVLQCFLFLNLLLPYVKLVMSGVCQYERRYRVSERVFSASIKGADMMGKRGMEASHAVYSLNDGKVGESINRLLLWWFTGFAGGLHEGIGEGLNIVSRTRSEHPTA